ncbi:fam11a b protein [Anaeramoeba flamelloides]|uniref:Fam11a b protein n=1 Tax=Anaeramoeba flamelloides TaxID=1746091 RepID=A0AAV7YUN0_9EUKA|nr:fam11a b protein [Anaeramoeba flamelloides]
MNFGGVLFCLSLLIGTIFIGLRLDNTIDWDWSTVFIPFWVFDALFGYFILSASLRLAFEGQRLTKSMYLLIVNFMYLIPYFVFRLMLARKLDNLNSVTYTKAFGPLFFIGIFSIIVTIITPTTDNY